MRRSRAWAIALIATLVAAPLVVAETFVNAEPAAARYAEGGDGEYLGSIDWMEWGAHDAPVQNGDTATSTRTVGGAELSTTCTINNITEPVTAYRPGAWSGDALDNLYNIGGEGAANTMVYALATADGGTPNFDISCETTLDGAPVGLGGLVIADAEASNWIPGRQMEYVQATPAGDATWRIIERTRSAGCATNVLAELSADDTLRLRPDARECGSGPAAIGFMDGATAANVEMRGGGKSAVALGVVLEADFGDAPESYGAAGALFERAWQGGTLEEGTTNVFGAFELATQGQPNTRLGEQTIAEVGHEFSDDASLAQDDDALDEDPGTIAVTPGEQYTLEDVS